MTEPTSALPDLLTVEEAARVLRIGRTKAYALTQEWRASGGKTGLPVVDLGSVLRVPRHALETVIGAALTGPAFGLPPEISPIPIAPQTQVRQSRTSSRRRPPRDRDQLRLLDLTDPAS
jgi:hypothetical protein